MTREPRTSPGDDEARTDGGTTAHHGSSRFDWLDGSLFTLAVASSTIIVLGGLVQVSFGTYSMSIEEAWQAVFDPVVWTNPGVLLGFFLGDDLTASLLGLFGMTPTAVDLPRETLIVWNIRLPRVLVAVFVGANLAISGAIFQAVTRNELASPFVLGVSSGAGLAILATLVVFSGLTTILPIVAALGGTAAFLLVYAIAWNDGTSPVRLVLAGVVVSTVFNSMQRGLFFFAEDLAVVQSALAWTTGSLTGVDWVQVRMLLPWSVVSIVAAIVAARQLNVLLLGERTASALGMSVERVRFALSGIAIVAAAASIAAAGIVSFVGLVVPHVVRNLVGSDYRQVLVGCLFVGPALLVGADVGARLALSPTQLPVGVVTGLVGGPYFLYLMRKKQQVGGL
ncbi:FecCD family ABC transporter permease [Haloarchaeobius sp. TZWWS8]|uniref:FecCD family ABC transporter permease n=1 Tax=Haloarchaeobius sp. TZWWS8 TaxID=3446121 RepID=UPI003EBFA948